MKFILSLCIITVTFTGYALGGNLDRLQIEPDVVYGHKAGLALTYDVFRPTSQNGAAIIFINSGGFISPNFSRQCIAADGDIWRAGDSVWRFREPAEIEPALLRQVSFEKLLEAGFTVFDVRHGSSPHFTLDEIVVDCRRAVRAIRRDAVRFGIDPDRLGVWGGSAGGYLAGYLAFAAEADDGDADDSLSEVSAAVQAAVLYYPAGYDLNEFPFLLEELPALGLPGEVLDTLSLKHFISPDDPPTMIIWGDREKDFIAKPANEIHTALRDQGCVVEGIVFPGVGHVWLDEQGQYDPERGEEALEAMVGWFSRHLK